MNTTQKGDFERRRGAVLRRHIANDPKLRAMRRKRKLSMVFSLAGSLVVIAAVMLLIKSFLLALHGPQGYARIMAPVLDGQPRDSLVVQIVGPDPVSDGLADLLRPVLPSARTSPVAISGMPLQAAPALSEAAEGAPDI